MACIQDSDLLMNQIAVDNFRVDARYYFLTHAHFDHMKGLTAHFAKKRQSSKIYATHVTAALAKFCVAGLKDADFCIVPYCTPVKLARDVTVTAYPSYHMDGSSMFLFTVGKLKILYTGDFRFRNELRRHLADIIVDRLYIDDTFDEIETVYPCYEETVKKMLLQITELQELGHSQINIHTSIVGLEPLLREVGEILGAPFGLSAELRNTWRGEQLKYLLGAQLNENQDLKVTLGNHKLAQPSSIPWVIPSCTYFLCNDAHRDRQPKHHHYIFFCTHSNHFENNQMRLLVSAKKVIACGAAIDIDSMQCMKSIDSSEK